MPVIKKYIVCVLIAFLTSAGMFGVSADNSEIVSEKISEGVEVLISDGSDGTLLRDGYRGGGSKITLNLNDVITVTSKTKFYGFYIVWDRPTVEWEFDIKSRLITGGKNGFIHEFIPIVEGANEATIKIPADNTIVCEIELYTEGTLPQDVQVWNPPYERADMLILPTHADDEFLFFGGTLPYYGGELGLKVQVAYMTNHFEYQWQNIRPHEMLDGLWSAGITSYPVISDFPDNATWTLESAKTVYDVDLVEEYQVELIRRFKPMVIIGHDINGEYGHGGHMLNTATLIDALEISNDESIYPKSADQYGVWDVPKTYLHLYDENKVDMQWDTPLKRFGGKTGYEMAIVGLNHHKSQLEYYSMSKKGVYDCTDFGLYRSTVGEDKLKNDFLENITLYSEPEPEPEPDISVIDEEKIYSQEDSDDEIYPDIYEGANDPSDPVFLFTAIGVLIATVSLIFVGRKRK